MMDGVQLMTAELFARVLEDARQSPRLRKNFNFHASLDENPSRFLNVMVRGTYFTPHRHIDPPKPESFVVLQGCVVLFTFDERGSVTDHYRLGPGEAATGIDLAPGIWHTLAVLSKHAVCFEVKPGPYSAASDKDFAPWAPREGNPGCREYQEALVSNISPAD